MPGLDGQRHGRLKILSEELVIKIRSMKDDEYDRMKLLRPAFFDSLQTPQCLNHAWAFQVSDGKSFLVSFDNPTTCTRLALRKTWRVATAFQYLQHSGTRIDDVIYGLNLRAYRHHSDFP